jgi:phosphoglycolate phosphatase
MSRFPFPQAIVFDLDGTLVDSVADIATALNAAVAPLAGGAFALDDVKLMIGGGSMVLIRKALDSRGVTLDEQAWTETLQRFMRVYSDVSAEGRGLYPGAHELLRHLRVSGIKTAICTNKPAPVTHIAVKALGLDSLVDFTIGASDSMPKKPHADMLLACCTALKAAPAATIMVGDSAADHGAAVAAGAACIMVDFGYSKVPVAQMKPDAVVSRLLDIPGLLLPRA